MLSELKGAAGLVGLEVETLEQGIRKMQKGLVEGGRGSQRIAEAFQAMGIRIQDVLKLSPEEQFTLVADRIGRIADPTRRAAAAMQVFGRSGTALLPLIEGGAEGLERARKEVRDLGRSMSTESAAALAKFWQAFERISLAAGGLKSAIGSALAPMLTGVIKWLTPLVKAGIDWVRANKQLVTTVFAVSSAVVGLGVGLGLTGIAFEKIGTAVSWLTTPFSVLRGLLGVVFGAIMALASPAALVAVALLAFAGVALYIRGAFGDLAAWLSGNFVETLRGLATHVQRHDPRHHRRPYRRRHPPGRAGLLGGTQGRVAARDQLALGQVGRRERERYGFVDGSGVRDRGHRPYGLVRDRKRLEYALGRHPIGRFDGPGVAPNGVEHDDYRPSDCLGLALGRLRRRLGRDDQARAEIALGTDHLSLLEVGPDGPRYRAI